MNRFPKDNPRITYSCVCQLNKPLGTLSSKIQGGAITPSRDRSYSKWSKLISAEVQLSYWGELDTRQRLKWAKDQLLLPLPQTSHLFRANMRSPQWPQEGCSIPFFFSFFDGAFGAACWSGWPLVVLVSTSLDMARRQTADSSTSRHLVTPGDPRSLRWT